MHTLVVFFSSYYYFAPSWTVECLIARNIFSLPPDKPAFLSFLIITNFLVGTRCSKRDNYYDCWCLIKFLMNYVDLNWKFTSTGLGRRARARCVMTRLGIFIFLRLGRRLSRKCSVSTHGTLHTACSVCAHCTENENGQAHYIESNGTKRSNTSVNTRNSMRRAVITRK